MRRTPVYIICSPRPQVGKTLVARLLCEFLIAHRGIVAAYDMSINEPSLIDFHPRITETASIDDTFGQMELMDKLIYNDNLAKVIDLGFHAYDGFFKMCAEIGFVKEAERRGVDPIILFVADIDRTSVRTFDDLRARYPMTAIIAVENEHTLRGDLPATFRSVRRMRIAALQPFLKSYISRQSFSFTEFLRSPQNRSSELYDWIRDSYMQFRELETNLDAHRP
ncbi:MAG: hypothetical protein ACOY4O_20435 [Pseudomonadota bacterium]|jgi:hypothetical protein